MVIGHMSYGPPSLSWRRVVPVNYCRLVAGRVSTKACNCRKGGITSSLGSRCLLGGTGSVEKSALPVSLPTVELRAQGEEIAMITMPQAIEHSKLSHISSNRTAKVVAISNTVLACHRSCPGR